MSAKPRSSKGELRRRYKALRDGVPLEQRRIWSGQVAEHLSAFCAAAGISRVALFGPFGSEVDLGPFEFDNPQISFLFPRVVSLDPPRLAWGPRPLEPGLWGLLEPAVVPYVVPDVQLMLVPGLAFAADGHRLGYGKGFYDSALAALKGPVIPLGVAFELQRCERLPTEPDDMPVQGLATEAGITWIEGADWLFGLG